MSLSTGLLGQGLSIAVGMVLAEELAGQKRPREVMNVIREMIAVDGQSICKPREQMKDALCAV